MKSIVKGVKANGSFDNDYGTMYKFEYTMEDGVSLSANHKKEGGNFPVGSEVEYEIKGSNKYGGYGSVKKPDAEGFSNKSSGGGGGNKSNPDTQRMIARQSSLKVALDYLSGEKMLNSEGSDLKLICQTAEYFTNYVLSPPKGSDAQVSPKVEKVPVNAPITPNKDFMGDELEAAKESEHLGTPDDLPF